MSVYGYIIIGELELTKKQFDSIALYQYTDLIFEKSEVESLQTLQSRLESMSEKDTLIIYDLTVIAKNNLELKKIFQILEKKKINLISIQESIETANNDLFFKNVLDVLYAEEFNYQKKQKIRQENSRIGRPTVSEKKIQKIQEMYHYEKKTMRQISEETNVSLGAVHKYVKQQTVS